MAEQTIVNKKADSFEKYLKDNFELLARKVLLDIFVNGIKDNNYECRGFKLYYGTCLL